MLDRKLIREDIERVRRGLARKAAEVDLNRWVELDEQHRSMLQEVEQLKARRNEASEAIGAAKRAGLVSLNYEFQ